MQKNKIYFNFTEKGSNQTSQKIWNQSGLWWNRVQVIVNTESYIRIKVQREFEDIEKITKWRTKFSDNFIVVLQ